MAMATLISLVAGHSGYVSCKEEQLGWSKTESDSWVIEFSGIEGVAG